LRAEPAILFVNNPKKKWVEEKMGRESFSAKDSRSLFAKRSGTSNLTVPSQLRRAIETIFLFRAFSGIFGHAIFYFRNKPELSGTRDSLFNCERASRDDPEPRSDRALAGPSPATTNEPSTIRIANIHSC
jgi:hypothetical protein